MIPSNTLSPRFYFPLYRWRLNRHRTSQLLTRHCITRHVLRSSPLPLCSLHRGCIRYYGRIRTLIPTIHGLHPQFYLSKNPFSYYICRRKHNILPPTLPRSIRNTATLLRLPRRLHNMKYCIINRLIYFPNGSHPNSVYNLRGFRLKTGSLNRRTINYKPGMVTRMPTTISHVRRTYIC